MARFFAGLVVLLISLAIAAGLIFATGNEDFFGSKPDCDNPRVAPVHLQECLNRPTPKPPWQR